MLTELSIFHCGWMRLPRRLLVEDAEWSRLTLPLMGVMVRHRDYGPVLIDAPFGSDGAANLGRLMDSLWSAAGLRFEPDWSTGRRLEQMGVSPSDVEHLLTTHLHFEHTGGASDVPNARVHVARSEWETVCDYGLFDAALNGCSWRDRDVIANRVSNFSDPPPLSETVDEASSPSMIPGEDIFGDGSVVAVGLPGHTSGHVGYLLTFADGTRWLHAGDAAFSRVEVTRRREPGIAPRFLADDGEEMRRSLHALRELHQQFSDIELIVSHAPDLGARCLQGPATLYAASETSAAEMRPS